MTSGPESSNADPPIASSGHPARYAPATAAIAPGRLLGAGGMLFGAMLVLCVVVYVALTVPGNWFPDSTPKRWGARALTLVRGNGALVGDELVIAGPDASGIVLVSLQTNLRADDYPAIAWSVAEVPEQAKVQVLWRSDLRPGRLNSASVRVEAGALHPTILGTDPAWIGRITGVALVIRGPFPRPIRIRGVTAEPLGALAVMHERASEWLTFEGWSGTSINVVSGGADDQELPLLPLFGVVLVLSGFAILGFHFWRPAALPAGPALAVWIGAIASAWFVLDARWVWNLARQASITEKAYAGKSIRDKHLASEDGQLFAFVEQARAIMPKTPVRVFVVSDIRYFRERAAYHLLPHNAFTGGTEGVLPPAGALHPGDWILVYERKDIQYDPTRHTLRWGAAQPVTADRELAVNGGALFLVR